MDERKVVEAILLVADEPVPAGLIGEVLERPRREVEALLEGLAQDYLDADRGFVLRPAGGGWRLYSSPECHPWLERFVAEQTNARLTGAALEVLAIVAYRQPIARAQVTEIRGVDSDGVVRTLLQRGLVEEVGHALGPGAPALLAVSNQFLERMGLNSVADLPTLTGFMPSPETVADMEAKLSPDV